MQCSSISAIPPFDRMVLLLRHAEREAVTDLRTHEAVPLTEQGRRDARALGAVLGSRYRRMVLWHSPTPRCGHTAESLAGGAAQARSAARVEGALAWLGTEPVGGDAAWLNEQVARKGHEGFLRLWFDGRYPSDQIAPLARLASAQMSAVLAQLEGSPSPVVIDVTHDWNLMLLREHYLGLRHEDADVPAYLDSVAVLRRGAVTTAWSLGRSVRIDGGHTTRQPLRERA